MNLLLYQHSKQSMILYSLFFIGALVTSQTIRAETTGCTPITTIPTTITIQGIYCFTGHLATSITSGNAITINVNNVSIDMNGYKLGGLGAGDGTAANGIVASQRKNITIRNGVIRGFQRGIYFVDDSPYITSQGHLIEDILVDQNTQMGIYAAGRGITLRHNRILDTGGTTAAAGFAYGVALLGPGHKVLNNDITTVVSTSGTDAFAYGLHARYAPNVVIQNNRITDIQADGTGNDYGIYLVQSNHVTTRDNIITTADYGIYYTGTASGIYRDNIADNVTSTDYTGGTDGGGNI